VDPRAGPDDLEKRKFLTLQGLELRPLGRPARSQSLYRLRYPGFLNPVGNLENLDVDKRLLFKRIFEGQGTENVD
jgi:hypothetical protein